MTRRVPNWPGSLVSIIMPVRNPNLNYFEQAVHSVLAQHLTDFTLFIIDDGGIPSDMLSRAKALDERIVVLRNHSTHGISHARNVALKICESKYVAFLDCDDLWLPEKLLSQVDFMEQNGVVISHGDFELIDNVGNTKRLMVTKNKVLFTDQLVRNQVPNLTGMYNREIVGDILQQPIIHEDFVMWTKLIQQYGFSMRCPGCYSKYRVHAKNFTSSKTRSWSARFKILRSMFGQSITKSALLVALGAFALLFNRVRNKF